jgi:hypothetical protein
MGTRLPEAGADGDDCCRVLAQQFAVAGIEDGGHWQLLAGGQGHAPRNQISVPTAKRVKPKTPSAFGLIKH